MRIFTGGSFDILHVGHVEFLHYLWNFGVGPRDDFNDVIVSLNHDEFIESYKGSPPVNNYSDRADVLSMLRSVAKVIPNEGNEDSRPAILSANPQVVAIGSDWHHPKDYLSQMSLTWEWLHENEISLLYYPRVTDISTTQIKEKLKLPYQPPPGLTVEAVVSRRVAATVCPETEPHGSHFRDKIGFDWCQGYPGFEAR